MKIIKYVPNVLSVLRIILALSLLFIPVAADGELLPLFLTVYIIAGITDMIDGPLARKFKVTSELGANLDGIADYTFIAVALFRLVPVLNFDLPLVISLIAVFALLKIIGMLVGYIRYKQLMMMHTYAAKTGAFLAFLFPLAYHYSRLDENTIIIFLALYVYAFLIEEIAINMVMPEPRRDISSFRHAWKIRREMMAKNE